MEATFWHKQAATGPLFPDLLWSKPENRSHAGKLLIIGGNLHGFSAPASAYQYTQSAGIGVAKVLLPDALQKTVGSVLENGEFAPSTPSGSFSQKALATWLDWSMWADGVLIAGDLGRNSETAITLEHFCQKYTGQLIVTKDAVDYCYTAAKAIADRPNTLLVLSVAQLQKLCTRLQWRQAVSFSMPILQFVQLLHELTDTYALSVAVRHNQQVFIATSGQVSSTPSPGDPERTWRIPTASYASTWWIQNPAKSFEALTTTAYELQNPQA